MKMGDKKLAAALPARVLKCSSWCKNTLLYSRRWVCFASLMCFVSYVRADVVNSCETDDLHPFAKLFQTMEVKSLLEFGMGKGTRYFLDHCKEVTSVEILAPEGSDQRYQECVHFFGHLKRWKPILYRGSAHLGFASRCALFFHKDAALYDSHYVLELKKLCDGLFQERRYEAAFVDSSISYRADLVLELFDRADIIVAHEMNRGAKAYGWDKISAPSNYVKIPFVDGMGTTVWVRKEKKEVIEALGGVLKREKKGLRVFFPNIHGSLTYSFGRALEYLGHTLVLPGDSLAPPSSKKLRKAGKKKKEHKIRYGSYGNERFKALLSNVEIIEKEQFFSHPPDIIFINCPEVEKDVIRMRDHLASLGRAQGVKLAFHSGNNQMAYHSKNVRNLLQSDAKTASLFSEVRPFVVHWIPWFDFERYAFQGCSDEPLLASYLKHHYSIAFPKGKQLFEEFSAHQKNELPDLILENFSGLGSEEVLKVMRRSAATLHIKDTEGIGYTILESLAAGRPVFLKRSFSQGSRMMNWCIEGKTAFFFDTIEELTEKVQHFFADAAFRHEVQQNCAQIVRWIIDNEKQARVLDAFLQNLK